MIKYIPLGTGSGKTHVHIELLKALVAQKIGPDGRYTVGIFITPKRDQIKDLKLDQKGICHFHFVGLDDFAEDWFIAQLRQDRQELEGLPREALSRLGPNSTPNAPKYALRLQSLVAGVYLLINDLAAHTRYLSTRPQDDVRGRELAERQIRSCKSDIKRTVQRIGEHIIMTRLEFFSPFATRFVGYTHPFQLALTIPCVIAMTAKKFCRYATVYLHNPRTGDLTGRVFHTHALIGWKPGTSAAYSSNPFQDRGTRFVIGIDEVEGCFVDIFKDQTKKIIKPMIVPQLIETFIRQTSEVLPSPALLSGGLSDVFDDLFRHQRDALIALGEIGRDGFQCPLPTKSERVLEFTRHTGLNRIGLGTAAIEYLYSKIVEEGSTARLIFQHATMHIKIRGHLLMVNQPYEKFHRWLVTFLGVRTAKMPAEAYRNCHRYLSNIFTYNHLNLISIDQMRSFVVSPRSGNSPFVNVSRPLSVDPTDLTLYDFVVFFLILIEVINGDQKADSYLIGNIKVPGSQDVILDQIAHLETYIKAADIQQNQSPMIDNQYVHEDTKNIFQFPRQKNYSIGDVDHGPVRELNKSFWEFSLQMKQLKRSPEALIIDMVTDTQNVLFLLSATAMVGANFVNSFNMPYLQRRSTYNGQPVYLFENHDHAMANFNRELTAARLAIRNFELVRTRYRESNLTDQSLRRILEAAINFTWPNTTLDLNPYKIGEIRGLFENILEMGQPGAPKSVIYGVQTPTRIEKLLKAIATDIQDPNFALTTLYQRKNGEPWHGLAYKLRFRGQEFKLLFYSSPLEKELPEGEYKRLLQLGADGKIILITSYKSANRGLNFIIEREGKRQDFEVVDISIDPYYSLLKANSSLDEEADFHRKYVYMKHLINENRLVSFQDFIQDFETDVAFHTSLNTLHGILVALEIVQMIGRIERENFEGQRSIVKLNAQSIDHLRAFYGHLIDNQAYYIDLLSPLNYEVYREIYCTTPSFASDEARDDFMDDQVESLEVFRTDLEEMLGDNNDFSSEKIVVETTPKRWAALRTVTGFNDPGLFLQELKATGMFSEEFLKALYFVPEDIQGVEKALYFAGNVKSRFKNLLDTRLISDHKGAETAGTPSPYDFKAILCPALEGLLRSGNRDALDIFARTGIDFVNMFKNWVPRPSFLTGFLKGILGELILEAYVDKVLEKSEFSPIVKLNALNYMEAPYLFEKGDLYLRVGKTLIGLDAKNLTRMTSRKMFALADVKRMFEKKMRFIEEAKRRLGIERIVYAYSAIYHADGSEFQSIPISGQDKLYAFNIFLRDGDQYKVSQALDEIFKEALKHV
jgi:hypothetical protein